MSTAAIGFWVFIVGLIVGWPAIVLAIAFIVWMVGD